MLDEEPNDALDVTPALKATIIALRAVDYAHKNVICLSDSCIQNQITRANASSRPE